MSYEIMSLIAGAIVVVYAAKKWQAMKRQSDYEREQREKNG
jgi:hypothetical protein